MAGAYRQRRERHGALPDRGRRQPLGYESSAVQRTEEISRQVVPHEPLSPRRHRLHGQAGGGGRYGATAVQSIPEIAQQAKQLTVFQRTANYCVPARNGKVDPELVNARKADYDGVLKRIKESFFGFEYNFIPKSVLEVTPEEREREFDRMWDEGGFAFWLANYQDMFLSQEANDLCADYIKRKIRKTVKDPVIAEKLIPKGHPYGTKRQPHPTAGSSRRREARSDRVEPGARSLDRGGMGGAARGNLPGNNAA